MIHHALSGKAAAGVRRRQNVRDWLYVLDHCAALRAVLERGRPGEPTTSAGSPRSATSMSCAASARSSRKLVLVRRDATWTSSGSSRPSRARPALRDGLLEAERRAGLGAAGEFDSGVEENRSLVPRERAMGCDVTSGAYRTWVEVNYAKRGAA
jgi:dTDP-glucose 4,6-dehydratase